MSVKLTVPDDLLLLPKVAEALQAFIHAVSRVRMAPPPSELAQHFYGQVPQRGRRGPVPRDQGTRDLPPVAPRILPPPKPVREKAKMPPVLKREKPAPPKPLPELPPPAPRAGRPLPPVLPAPPTKARPQKIREPLPPPLPREPKAPKAKPAPRVKEPVGPMDFPEFEASLPTNSQRFLALVRARGSVRVDDVLAELDLDSPKAVGGITGAISRWAPVRGVEIPYETLTIEGERVWHWLGTPMPTALPVVTKKQPTLDEVLARLSAPARKLLDAVRGSTTLSINDAVSVAGVNRASALGVVLAEIREVAEGAGFKLMEDTVDMRGGRVFKWIWVAPVAAPQPVEGATEDPSRAFATDGVIRRRRKE